MAKNNKIDTNIIFWAIGIVIFLIVLTQLPLIPWFAIVTKVTCMDNTVSYWDFDGNVLDTQGLNNGNAYNISYIPGKLGQEIRFNGTGYVNFPAITTTAIVMWITNYSAGDTDSYFVANLNGTNYVNGALDNTKQIIPIGPNFGLGLNVSVDEMATFTSLSVSDMLTIYNEGNARKVCYTVSAEENISCKDFATEQVTDPGTGCLNYSGDFFPNCTYEWETTSQYKIEDNKCERYFYCQNPCLTTGNCYTSNQACIEKLTYDCYLIINNKCVKKTDYASCVTNISHYTNLTACQSDLNVTTPTVTTPTVTTPTNETTMETIKAKLSEKIFEIYGYEITLLHFLIALIVIITILYFTGAFGKKK